MRILSHSLFAAALLILGVGPSHAAPNGALPDADASGDSHTDPAGAVTLSLQGGMLWPLWEWDLGRGHRTSGVVPGGTAFPFGGGAIGYQLTRQISAEVDVFGTVVTTNVQSTATAMSFGATGFYNLGKGPVSPYVLAGAGVYYAPNGLLATDVDPVVRVGGGMRALLPQRAGVRMDVRYAATDGFEKYGAPNLEVRFALDLYLSLRDAYRKSGPDYDGDSVLDSHDACFDQPGSAAMFGCPDTDRDGVDDIADACPLQAGPAQDDGCPDTDGDWVADHRDWCPTRPGTIPLEGCPEVNPMEMLSALQNVPFHFNHATLTPEAKESLAVVASFLIQNPLVQVKVAGHTDNLGEPGVNQVVSELRSAAVINHLVYLGVARERFESAGYGSSQPLAENDEHEGRVMNRRVELVGHVAVRGSSTDGTPLVSGGR